MLFRNKKRKIQNLAQSAEQYVKETYQELPEASASQNSCFCTDAAPGIKYSQRDYYETEKVSSAMENFRKNQDPAALSQILQEISCHTFAERVMAHMQRQGLSNSAVYRAAQMDRRLFSKMLSDRNFKPSKDTAIAVICGLRLNSEQAVDLLERAGYTLSHSNQRDIVIEYFISQGIYNLNDMNAVLEQLGMKIIGRKMS